MQVGRPPFPYNPEIGEEICQRLATSEDGLEQILDEMRLTRDDHIPSLRHVYCWLDDNPQFLHDYARARLLQGQLLHDRAQVYARSALVGMVRKVERTGDKETVTETSIDNVERSKLMVGTTLKRAAHLNPMKYSDATMLRGDPANPLKIDASELIAKIMGSGK